MNLISFRSARSKRVASSTMSAETLALCAGTEEGIYLQTWLREIESPLLSARELINAPSSELMSMLPCTDCNDIYELLVSPAHSLPSNKSQALFVSALREDKSSGRVNHWGWIDTRDMLANPLTKLDASGNIEWQDLRATLQKSKWHPSFPYRIDGTRIYPPSSTAKASLMIDDFSEMD